MIDGNNFTDILQMVVTIPTLFISISSLIMTKKLNKENNLAQISTLHRKDRMINMQKLSGAIVHYSDPDYLLLCSDEEKTAAFAALSENIYSLAAILHGSFVNDEELIGLGKYIKKMIYKLIAEKDKQQNEAFIKQIRTMSNLFLIQSDRYTYADWERVKEEINGDPTKSRLWLDIYSNLGKKFTHQYESLGIAADFHCHTLESDGIYSPSQVIDLALKNGLNCVAIADHDTIAAQEEAIAYARGKLIYIPAIEISCKTYKFKEGCEYALHILGYGINAASVSLSRNLGRMERQKEQIYAQMLNELKKRGYGLNDAEITAKHGKLRQMSDYVAKLKEVYPLAMDDAEILELIGRTNHKLDEIKPSPQEAIRWIKEANGVPVLAHPRKTYQNEVQVDIPETHICTVADKLKEAGLMGLEVYYLGYTESQIASLRRIAKKQRLLMSCGGDFHGSHGREGMVCTACPEIEPFLSMAVAKIGHNDC